MKKFVIISLIIIFLAVAGLAIFRKKTPPITAPGEATLVPPAPTMFIQSPKNVSFFFDAAFTPPTQLPTYLYEDRGVSVLENALRANLNTYAITASPSSLSRADTKTVTWSRDGADFTLTTTLIGSVITFHQNRALTLPVNKLSPSDTARAFIFALFPPMAGIDLARVGSQSGPFDGLFILDNFPQSDMVGELFSYTVGGFPIISTTESGPSASVVIDGNGIVRSATIIPPPGLITQAAPAPLITKDEISANLAAGRGAIISAYNEETAGIGGALTFTSFRISSASVVYAKQGGVLLPAFLLSGVGTSNTGQTQEATYFLWGFAAPKPTTTQP